MSIDDDNKVGKLNETNELAQCHICGDLTNNQCEWCNKPTSSDHLFELFHKQVCQACISDFPYAVIGASRAQGREWYIVHTFNELQGEKYLPAPAKFVDFAVEVIRNAQKERLHGYMELHNKDYHVIHTTIEGKLINIIWDEPQQFN